MKEDRAVFARFALCAVLFVGAALAGCGGGPGVEEVVSETPAYPDWVKMVPVSTDDVLYYLGSCVAAASGEEGLASAREEATALVEGDARERVQMLFNTSLQESRGQTTPMERHRLTTDVGAEFALRLGRAVETEHSYVRPCADGEPDGAVCGAFVLLRLGRDDERAVLASVLSEYRVKFREERKQGLVDIVERMQRAIEQ